ncbi:hypothetical protein ACFOY2_50115, partial [Nonomuraea purpurea]
PAALKGARRVRAGGHWKRTCTSRHLASGLPVLQHTASGLGGGLVVVDVVGVGTDLARIEVTDDGADTIPRPRLSDGLDSRGRGLRLVEQISTAWGLRQLGRSRHLTVWAEFPTVINAAHLCEATSNVLMREIGA